MGRRGKGYTAEEYAYIDAHYSSRGPKFIQAKYPHRPCRSITEIANRRGLRLTGPKTHKRSVTGDDAPCKVMDYGGISITWTVGEWRRLQKLKDSRRCVDTIGRGEA